MQELWKLGVHWDEALPASIHTKWLAFVSDLPALNDMSFDRQVIQNRTGEVELHGFCDASERAYGACIYLTSVDSNGVGSASLLCAKSRVAPIKTVQTIPRLELCAALLLANLYDNVKAVLLTQMSRSTFWTDSMITFHWINTSPHLLKNFVANRVSSIQSLTNPEDWRHVRTHENPADLLSRGATAEELKSNIIWFRGPNWLAGGESMWPPRPTNKQASVPELRSTTCLTASVNSPSILHRYSSFTKLQRIVALCRRVIPGNQNKGLITVNELRAATEVILRLVQKETFAAEYEQLMKGRPVPPSSRLKTLSPFIGDDGLIKVGGRLSHANISYCKKHPIVLPKSHHVTALILEKAHLECLHGGIQTTLSAVRQRYWPIDGRNQVRKVIRGCTRCTRANPPTVDYVMGDLPSSRTTMARPFTNTGMDYCGPFFIKEKKFRNRNKIKTYVAIFVCLSTKAVHLEVVSDLLSEAFIAALKRFISRRGKCETMASDNGTNFVGANNSLKELHELLSSEKHREVLFNYLANKEITWKFIPPRSPHCGGLWEAAVKSFKGHLKRVVNTDLFTFEQFNTLVIEIEAILNSRPLTPLSSDPNDLAVLTPAHFLNGDSLSGLPETNFSGTPSNRLSGWQHIQKVKRDFWVRWRTEYLHELNVRRKWAKGDHSLRQGSVVLIRGDNSPPMEWRMGRIIETYPGQDGVIRTVRVKTSGEELIRNVKGLTPLLEDDAAEPDETQS